MGVERVFLPARTGAAFVEHAFIFIDKVHEALFGMGVNVIIQVLRKHTGGVWRAHKAVSTRR